MTIILLLILSCVAAFASMDSRDFKAEILNSGNIEGEIQNYEESRTTIISKGRRLLLDNFLENDIEKVKEIKNYLKEKGEDKNHVALTPCEYGFILYWTKEYEELLNLFKAFDSTYVAINTRRTDKVVPPKDNMCEILESKSKDYAQKIINQIRSANISAEQKDLLILNFTPMPRIEQQDSINAEADNFLNAYPESEYKDYVKQYVRYKFVPADWGVASEVFSGYGIPAGTLSDKYTNNIPLGVALDIYYKKFESYLRMYLGFGETKEEIGKSEVVYNGDITTMLFETSFGYPVLDKSRLKIVPFLGIGLNVIEPRVDMKANPELEKLSLVSPNYLMGVDFDLRFGKNGYLFLPKTNYIFMRVRCGYSIPQLFSKNIDGMHYITVGFGIMERKVKREY